MSEIFDNSSPELDDETFIAVTKLNTPDAYAAVMSGANACPCPRCQRLRKVVANTPFRPLDVSEDPAEPLDVDALVGFFRSIGMEVEIVREPRGRVGAVLDAEQRFMLPTDFAPFEDYSKQDERDEAELRQARKDTPVASGVIAYFPKALCAVAQVSKIGNDQHNPGQPLHWARGKSTDETDALTRHLLDYLEGEDFDTDGALHLAKVAWRALALLERFLDGENPGR